jgi:CRP-like cAMP-binding protein
MSTLNTFKKGDFLFRQGDASDRVLLVKSGAVEILREVGESFIVLGNVRAGEWLGEMGVIENRSHSASARAIADGEVDGFTAQQFLERVSGDPVLARDLILRLSIRLREIENKVTGDLLRLMHDGFPDRGSEMQSELGIDGTAKISISADSDFLAELIGKVPIRISRLPYLVGRTPAKRETSPSQRPDLLVEDEEPFRLSRQHFAIARNGNRVLVSDVGSALGTIVNGQPIGRHFMRDSAPLHRGENHILAGGEGSPFKFRVSVG